MVGVIVLLAGYTIIITATHVHTPLYIGAMTTFLLPTGDFSWYTGIATMVIVYIFSCRGLGVRHNILLALCV